MKFTIADRISESEVPESDRDRAARYERALRAISGHDEDGTLTAASLLEHPDFGDWVQSVCEDVLNGCEAECPICGTCVHSGPCVKEALDPVEVAALKPEPVS